MTAALQIAPEVMEAERSPRALLTHDLIRQDIDLWAVLSQFRINAHGNTRDTQSSRWLLDNYPALTFSELTTIGEFGVQITPSTVTDPGVTKERVSFNIGRWLGETALDLGDTMALASAGNYLFKSVDSARAYHLGKKWLSIVSGRVVTPSQPVHAITTTLAGQLRAKERKDARLGK